MWEYTHAQSTCYKETVLVTSVVVSGQTVLVQFYVRMHVRIYYVRIYVLCCKYKYIHVCSDCGDCRYPMFPVFCIQSKAKTDLATMTEGYEEKLSKAEEELAAVQVQTALSCTVHTVHARARARVCVCVCVCVSTYVHTYVCCTDRSKCKMCKYLCFSYIPPLSIPLPLLFTTLVMVIRIC